MEERMTMTKDQMLGELFKCRQEISEYMRLLCSENDTEIIRNTLYKIKELAEKEELLRFAIKNKMYTEKSMTINESLRKDIKRIFGRY